MLSDEKRRSVYDQTGSTEGQEAAEDFFRGFQGFQGFGQQQAGFGEEAFARTFAEMFMGGGATKRASRGGQQNVTIGLEVDFLEAVNGVEKVTNRNYLDCYL